MDERARARAFEVTIGPHLRAAYSLARWLLRNEADAEDVLQESVLRAFRAFDAYAGGSARSWLLSVVRNSSYTFLQKGRAQSPVSFDETLHSENDQPGPDAELIRKADAKAINQSVAALAPEFREVFILRELEGLSYKEISEVAGIPLGTVMSRLSRARVQLQAALGKERA